VELVFFGNRCIFKYVDKWQGGGQAEGGETVGLPGIRESLDSDGNVRLKRWLARAAAERITGALRVSGGPGGVLWLRDGLVVAVQSPGAPGVEALLIRTGRVSDEDWARDGGVDRAASAGRIGAAHRQVLQFMANQDALFAMLVGSIESCVLEPDPSVSHAIQGQDAIALLDAAFRKLDALALLPQAILPHRERLIAASADDGRDAFGTGSSSGIWPSELRKVILGYADGRRTARDIAFVSGRSLYAVTVEMSRMLVEGLLQEPPPRIEPIDPSSVRVLPRNPAHPSPGGAQTIEVPSELPSRRPSAATAAEDAASQRTAAFWRDFLHFGGRTGESRD
jgi:hypothetical protein